MTQMFFNEFSCINFTKESTPHDYFHWEAFLKQSYIDLDGVMFP